MKSNIISIAAVNIVWIGFILITVFLQFGTDIEVVKKVDSLPVDIGYTQSSIHQTGKAPITTSHCKVKIKPEDEDIDPFWVNAKDVFGTEDERKLQKMIDKEETIRLNIFINPKTDEVLGVTTKGTSRWALIYNNNKLVKYGLAILAGVDLFLVGLVIFSEKMKRRQV